MNCIMYHICCHLWQIKQLLDGVIEVLVVTAAKT